jgi:serine phosphatase RsbU (regulator of sigma subunit)
MIRFTVNELNGRGRYPERYFEICMKSLKEIHQRWMHALSKACSHTPDTKEDQLRKTVLILLAGTYGILGLLWAAVYFTLGLPLPGSFPLGYSIITGVTLLFFFRTKNYRFFCLSQLLLILVLPFFLQWSLGGFAPSSAVIIWSILSPVGALMFAGTTRALPWFLAYLLLMVLSGWDEIRVPAEAKLPPIIVVISYVMNIGGVSAIVFFLLKYFVHARELAMAALDKEHRRVRHSLSLAMEVQQNLLPQVDPEVDGLDIAGTSIYCDETGGDYYDYLRLKDPKKGKIGVVVGDVSDHGIPSALLMATARAIIRQGSSLSNEMARVVSDANRQLVDDVKETGRFMTLFYTEIDRPGGQIRWLNAGHESAVIYDSVTDTFEELAGEKGLPLGLFGEAEYKAAQREIRPGQILVLATDGIWEVMNPQGEMFGRDRMNHIIRKQASMTSKEIQQTLLGELSRFRRGSAVRDDMTLVIIKIL